MHKTRLAATALAATLCLFAPAATQAAASTSRGQISVAQVMDMLVKAQSERTARQVLVAYLGGVGETAGLVTGAGEGPRLACGRALQLDPAMLPDVLKLAAPDSATWQEVAATPIIVTDMLARAGCR